MHPGLLQLLERNKVSVGESLDALTADHTKVLGCLTGVDRTAEEALKLLDGKYCLTGGATWGLSTFGGLGNQLLEGFKLSKVQATRC